MVKEGYMEFEGIVENFAHDKFFVKVKDDFRVLCVLSGKMRQAGIKIMIGDKVKIESSVYSPTMGRIVFRLK